MPKCEHGLTSKECYVCASPKHAEQAEKQEPVAWMDAFGNVFPLGAQRGPKYLNEPMKPLYTAPQPQREWVGLTDDEIIQCTPNWIGTLEQVARAVEAKLKEKNT